MLKRNKSEIWEDDALNRKSFYRTVSEPPQDDTDTDDDNETKTLRTTMKTVTSAFTLDDWQNAVLEKEKEIRLVAEIGKNLLDKNCQLEQQLKHYVDAEISRNQQFEENQHKIKELKKEKLLLEDQLRHAEFFNLQVLRELKEKEEAVKIRTVEKKLNVFLSEQNKQLVEKLEQTKTDLEAKVKTEAGHKRDISRLERQIKFMEESHNRTKELILEKSKEKIHKLTHNEELTKLKIQFDQLSEDLHRREQQLEEIMLEKKKIEDKARSLAKRNEELKIENEFKTTELIRLQQTLEEEKLSSPYGSNANTGNATSVKGSLFSELQQELSKSPSPPSTKPSHPASSVPTSPIQTPSVPTKATASAPATPVTPSKNTSTPVKPSTPSTPSTPSKATAPAATPVKATTPSPATPVKTTTPTQVITPSKTAPTPSTAVTGSKTTAPSTQKPPLLGTSQSMPVAVTPVAPAAEVPQEKDERPDPKEEYFYLTASAMKINLAMKNKSEHVFLIREADLFNLVLQEGIPFHEWHKWLKKKLLERVREFEIKESLKKNNRKSMGPMPVTRDRRNSLV